jgi:hypothetical protein
MSRICRESWVCLRRWGYVGTCNGTSAFDIGKADTLLSVPTHIFVGADLCVRPLLKMTIDDSNGVSTLRLEQCKKRTGQPCPYIDLDLPRRGGGNIRLDEEPRSGEQQENTVQATHALGR